MTIVVAQQASETDTPSVVRDVTLSIWTRGSSIYYLFKIDTRCMSTTKPALDFHVIHGELFQHPDDIGPDDWEGLAASSRNTEKTFEVDRF